MGSKGGFTLLGLLLILSVCYDSGHSLRCYTCLNPGGTCTIAKNCTNNFDACLHVEGETRTYYQCWKFENCNFNYLAKHLNEKDLKYECCQQDLCNQSGGMHVIGTAILLVTQLLAASWTLFI